jgi:lipopolysaccharide export system permease protein
MKKIDKLVLDAFLGPFLITFLVVVFLLLNVNMLKYFDDIIGKGLDLWTLGQLFFYFAIFTIPTALPLAVLLSSLISFGNLGEHFELTAIKAAGVSLIRAMRPIFFFVLILTGLAFYVNDNLVPKAALEAYSLLYDIKQKKPALDLREGSFYYGINDISIKVNKKFPDGITLKDVIVYDHRKNDGNKEVTIADSGKMYTIMNERYLKFELFNGYNYTEGASSERDLTGQKKRNAESMSRYKFGKTQVVFDLSSFQLQRTDKQWFQGNRMMRNMNQLDADIDSMRREILSQRLSQYQFRQTFFNYYARKDSLVMPREIRQHKLYKDSLERAKYMDKITDVAPQPGLTPKKGDTPTVDSLVKKVDTAKVDTSKADTPVVKSTTPANVKSPMPARIAQKRNSQKFTTKKQPSPSLSSARKKLNDKKRAQARITQKPVIKPTPKPLSDSVRRVKLDSMFHAEPDASTIQNAANAARQVKNQVANANAAIGNYTKELRVFEIQWHIIIANSFACIAMFLIGAPLGAIIKRGGLGVPFLVSILFFIIYYVVTMQGQKLAKQETLSIIAGVWLADFILFLIGLFFLKQARADARLFEADFYHVVFDKVKQWVASRKAFRSKYA